MEDDIATIIENTIDDLISNFLYYDRKEDEELPVGAIEKAVKDGVLSWIDIKIHFATSLDNAIENNDL